MLFAARLEIESDSKTRTAVLAHLHTLCDKVKTNRRVRMLRCWHGLRGHLLLPVLEGGFAATSTLDEGLFVHCD